jgi:transposase InsO family protein
MLIAGQPSYGYRRIHALLRRQRREQRGAAVNVKRVYRVMKAHGLLLKRHTGGGEEQRHDDRIAVDHPDTRWCSDGFEIGCDNGEKVRIAFTLDCCDREAISWVATTGGINSGDIRDLMIESVERRLGLVNKLSKPIEWLSDNGSPYTAGETRALARDIGLVPCTTPIQNPQSNGIGRGLRQIDQTGLRAGQHEARCGQCAASARYLVLALQHRASAQGVGLPLAARVPKTDDGEDDRERGRRWASIASKHNGHGGGRVKAAAAAGGAQRQP